MVINDVSDEVPTSTAPTVAHCPYCNAGLDRHGMVGKFIHVLTRDAEGRIAKFRPCTRQ